MKEPVFIPVFVQLCPDFAAKAAVSKIELTGMAMAATRTSTTENLRLALWAEAGYKCVRFTMSED